MRFYSCSHETDLSRALRDGTWPNACGAELQAHVAVCQHCSDLVLITQSLRKARAESMLAAPLPPPGLLWWKAQLRRRNAALERMNESMAVTGKVALASTLAAAIALGMLKAHDVSGWLRWFSNLPSSETFHFGTLLAGSSLVSLAPMIAGLAAIGLFGGLAVYLLAYKE